MALPVLSLRALNRATLARQLLLEHLVRRYLGAFGPATQADVVHFIGQGPARIQPVLERLRPKLRRFRDEAGRTLVDLPRAPRAPADTRAPVRFLPRYDELLVGHTYRDRVVAAQHRPALYRKNGIIEAAVLLDGVVARASSRRMRRRTE